LPLENIRPPSSGERGHLAVEFMGSLRPIWELPAVPAMAGLFVGHDDGACEAGVKGESGRVKPRRRRARWTGRSLGSQQMDFWRETTWWKMNLER
jgi:hypothetical protein